MIVFKVDQATGKLTPTGDSLGCPSPCVHQVRAGYAVISCIITSPGSGESSGYDACTGPAGPGQTAYLLVP